MKHKVLYYRQHIKGQDVTVPYRDTYTKPIKEVVEPFGVTYITFEEMFEKERYTNFGYYGTWSSHIDRNYRPVLASDGIFFLPKNCHLSVPSKDEHIPKRYNIAYNDILAHDALGQDIHGGDIVYYSYMRYRSIYHGFFFVRNITDGRGQLVCHYWNRNEKQFELTTRNINNICECIVIDKAKFLRKFEIEGFFVPEEYK